MRQPYDERRAGAHENRSTPGPAAQGTQRSFRSTFPFQAVPRIFSIDNGTVLGDTKNVDTGGVLMIKHLTKHGNSLALIIDRPILDLLRIDADTPLEISTDGQVLVVSPVRDAGHQRKFKKALEKVNRKYGRALKRLAE